MARSFSILRPIVNGEWSRYSVRCSLPCTKIRLGKTPDPTPEIGPIALWEPIAVYPVQHNASKSRLREELGPPEQGFGVKEVLAGLCVTNKKMPLGPASQRACARRFSCCRLYIYTALRSWATVFRGSIR